MLIIPLVQITAFWLIRQSNVNSSTTLDSSSTTSLIDNQSDENSPAMTALQPMTLAEKWEYLPKLMKYSIPLMITCWCEYTMGSLVSLMIEVLNSSPFISRNTFLQFDLLYVPGMRLTHADQYRWLEVYDVTCKSYISSDFDRFPFDTGHKPNRCIFGTFIIVIYFDRYNLAFKFTELGIYCVFCTWGHLHAGVQYLAYFFISVFSRTYKWLLLFECLLQTNKWICGASSSFWIMRLIDWHIDRPNRCSHIIHTNT